MFIDAVVEFAVTLFWNKTYHEKLGRIFPFGYLMRYIARALDKFLKFSRFSFIFISFSQSLAVFSAFSKQKYYEFHMCVEKEMQKENVAVMVFQMSRGPEFLITNLLACVREFCFVFLVPHTLCCSFFPVFFLFDWLVVHNKRNANVALTVSHTLFLCLTCSLCRKVQFMSMHFSFFISRTVPLHRFLHSHTLSLPHCPSSVPYISILYF